MAAEGSRVEGNHFLEVGLNALFWLTPIVYPSGFVYGRLTNHPFAFQLFLANPMADIIMGFQRALYAVVQPPTVDM